jgi:hypothetical protein
MRYDEAEPRSSTMRTPPFTSGIKPCKWSGSTMPIPVTRTGRAALKGLRDGLPVIGLSHIAEEADALWEAGVPLVFSGHTHAGQITVARLHELSVGKLAGHKYIHGLYGSRGTEDPKGAVYVGAGVGAAIVPLRLGERAKREVAFFELGTQPGAFDEHHGEQEAHAGRIPSEKTKERRAQAVRRKQQKRERRNGNGNNAGFSS